MRLIHIIFVAFVFTFCQGQSINHTHTDKPHNQKTTRINKVKDYYDNNKGNEQASKSTGTVSKGTLENGKLMPFEGENFQYFDTLSYLGGRAFTHDKVKKTILDTYQVLAKQCQGRQFFVMECSHKHGGRLFPHRTHQNGLSVDFMMPLVKGGEDYYGLDTIGQQHYWLEFDNEGKYSKDKSIAIDFNLVARHILLLDKQARNHGLKITKVIIKISLKDELFATTYGRQLKDSGIYIVKSLTPLINNLHDDHYHIDFGII